MGITPKVGLSARPRAAESSARLAVGSSGFVMSGTVIGLPAMTRSRLFTFSRTRSMTGNRLTTICPFSTFARLAVVAEDGHELGVDDAHRAFPDPREDVARVDLAGDPGDHVAPDRAEVDRLVDLGHGGFHECGLDCGVADQVGREGDEVVGVEHGVVQPPRRGRQHEAGAGEEEEQADGEAADPAPGAAARGRVLGRRRRIDGRLARRWRGHAGRGGPGRRGPDLRRGGGHRLRRGVVVRHAVLPPVVPAF